jgi:outer membrane lipoprotein LolB
MKLNLKFPTKSKLLLSNLAILLLLSACQTAPNLEGANEVQKFVTNQESIFTAKQQEREILSAWNLMGSFSYSDQEEVATGRIRWKSALQPNSALLEKVTLIGPVGAGAATLSIDSSSGASFVAGKTKRFGSDARSLLFDVVGLNLPIDELRYWIYGLPSPNTDGSFSLDEKGNLKSLKQSGWKIQYSDYRPISSPVNEANTLIKDYPRRIIAYNNELSLRIKLITKRLELKL